MISDTARIDACRDVQIKGYACICADVIILGHHHIQNLEYQMSRYKMKKPEDAVWGAEPLVIDKHAYIGTRAIILPQVTYIPKGVIIGAGSVLSKNPDKPNQIWAGNPARPIRKHDLNLLE